MTGTRRLLVRRSAFTLVELLVVIAVIVILASLLMPVVGSATGKARAAECVSNLRQIGAAMMSYLKDNDMYFQVSWSQMTAEEELRYDWSAVLLPYAPDSNIFKCPARKPLGYTTNGNLQRGIRFPINYGICTAIQGRLYMTLGQPSKTGCVADAGHDRFYAQNPDESNWGVIQVINEAVHDGQAGVLFADWHGELVRKTDIDKKMFLP
jgi:prepilin-type N-terminal cleavage/methylation domain-containing protein/prepilin-type processing-associated H-X9-DG protein